MKQVSAFLQLPQKKSSSKCITIHFSTLFNGFVLLGIELEFKTKTLINGWRKRSSTLLWMF
jgi:hypothetical protein